MITHGHTLGGPTPTYVAWLSMKSRCESGYWRSEHYAGRGIGVCQRWLESFEAFLADVGERPPGTTLDRIENDRGYEPGNVRWATPKQQARNRRNNKLEEHEPAQIRWLILLGYRQTDIARFFDISPQLVTEIKHGRRWA